MFAGSWATIGIQHLLAQPGTTSPVQTLYLFTFAVAVLILAAVATRGQALLAAILMTAAVRTVIAGCYQAFGNPGLQTAAGVLSLVITVLAFYGALALLLEDTAHQAVLPLARRGQSRTALEGRWASRPKDWSRKPASGATSDDVPRPPRSAHSSVDALRQPGRRPVRRRRPAGHTGRRDP